MFFQISISPLFGEHNTGNEQNLRIYFFLIFCLIFFLLANFFVSRIKLAMSIKRIHIPPSMQCNAFTFVCAFMRVDLDSKFANHFA